VTLRVVIGGWYGAANLGDELLLRVIADWVHEAGGTLIAISNAPEHTRTTHGIQSVAHDDLPALVEALGEADLFTFGGGGLLHDYFGLDRASLSRFPAHNATQFAQHLFIADELGLPTLALAQGVGPLTSEEAREIGRDVFTRASGVSLRDWTSAALLREIGVTRELLVAPDPVWAWTQGRERGALHSLSERFPVLEGRRVMAVIPREWPVDAHWEAQFVDILRGAIPEHWAVLWLDFQRDPRTPVEASSDIAQRMIASLGDGRIHVVWNGNEASEAFDLIAQCDACVAMRLHGEVHEGVDGDDEQRDPGPSGRGVVVLEGDHRSGAYVSGFSAKRAFR